VDVHSHFYTKEYIKTVENVDYLGVKNMKFVVSDAMYNLERRINDMEACGVDVQVLSLGPPGVDFFQLETAIRISREYNSELSMITDRYREKFLGFAAVPLIDPEIAVEEAERAICDLSLRGITVYSNIAGRSLIGSSYWGLFELAERYDVPVFLHPTTPLGSENMRDFGLTLIAGFLFDSSLTMLRMIFSGVLQRFQKLKLIMSHLGGVLPYIAKRIDIESESIDKRLGRPYVLANISDPPSHYLRKIFLDTVSLHEPAVKCAYETVGADRLVLGSDYPYWPLSKAVETIRSLPISKHEKELIMGMNASSILNI